MRKRKKGHFDVSNLALAIALGDELPLQVSIGRVKAFLCKERHLARVWPQDPGVEDLDDAGLTIKMSLPQTEDILSALHPAVLLCLNAHVQYES